MLNIVKELRRRSIFRIAGAYAVIGWLLAQVAVTLETALELPSWFDAVIVSAILIGFPIAMLLAWAFEVTPDGVKRATNADGTDAKPIRGLDYAVIGGLVLVTGLIGWQLLSSRGGNEAPATARNLVVAAAPGEIDRSKSIAVLPFDDFSADDHEWFADGLTEEILNSLARTPDLLVASRTSSFAYKNTDQEAPTIAKRLGVEHVLEGSVRRAGERLRVTVQLIRASDGFHLWSENYDRSTNDVIAIQEDIAIEIAQALKTAMDPQALSEMLSVGTRSVEAYEAYLEGLSLRRVFGADGSVALDDILDKFERARTIDPNFAAAHFLSAEPWRQNLTPTVVGARDISAVENNYREYTARIDAAIKAADGTPEQLLALADKAVIDFRLRDARDALTEYLVAQPLSAEAWQSLADVNVRLGDYPAARAAAKEQEKVVGDDVEQQTGVIIQYVWSKAYDEAAAAARRAIALDPDHWSNMYQAHRALLWAGATDEAAKLIPALSRAIGDDANNSIMVAQVRQACAEGNRPRAEQLAEEIFAMDDDQVGGGTAWIARHLLGQKEEAAQMIAKYDRARAPNLLQAWLYYPYFDHTRSPNFVRDLARENVTRPAPIDIPFACPPATVNEASIAVLPFADLSPAGDQEYFSDGIAEEILNVLARVNGLKVASRTSAFQFKDRTDISVPEIATELGVAHVLEGSVRKAGDNVRITAQLIKAGSDEHLWSETFDRTLTVENLFAIQDEIATGIVRELGEKMDLGRANTLRFAAAADTKNLRAYEAYLEGRELLPQRSNENLLDIIKKFETATTLDPQFARAFEALAVANFVSPSYFIPGTTDITFNANAQKAATTALTLDPQLPIAMVVASDNKGSIGSRDHATWLTAINRGLTIDPNEVVLIGWRGQELTWLGFLEDAEKDLRRALELDQTDWISAGWLVRNLILQKRMDEALRLFQSREDLTKNSSQLYNMLILALYASGDEVNARAMFTQNTENIPPGVELDIEHIEKLYFTPEDNPQAALDAFIASLGPLADFIEQDGVPSDMLHHFGDYGSINANNSQAGDLIAWVWSKPDFLNSSHRYRLMREQGLEAYWRENSFPPQCRMIDPLPDGRDFECD